MQNAEQAHQIGPDNTLAHLPHAKDAPFNSYAKQHEPNCLPDTRVDLLREIHSWVDGQDKRCIFWLSGLAGTGKSTIARTVARSYHDKQRLAASFFFSRGGGDVGHAGRFMTSLAVQLAGNVSTLKQHIIDAIKDREDIVSQSLRDQWHHLVLGPLLKLSDSDYPAPLVLVVDGLDECDSYNNIRMIVQLLAEARSLTKVRLRVLLTSRPEVHIRHEFCEMPDADHKDIKLHDISRSVVDHDISLFLQHNLQFIARERCLYPGWPGPEIVVQLAQSACGLFIWASTACRFIREGKRFAAKRLEIVLCNNGANSGTPERHLDDIYSTVLKNSIQDYTEEEKEEQCREIQSILGSIVVLLSPLSVKSLDQLLDITEGVRPTLEDLHAILDIPDDQSQPLRLHHPSFRDFLLDQRRCGDNRFYVDEKSTHEKLVRRCLELMSLPRGLRQDMCDFSDPGILLSEIDKDVVVSNLPPELQYACRYWVQHLESSGRSIEDEDATHCFLKTHLLHWLEAMSLMEEASLCVRLVARLQKLATPSNSTVAQFLYDALRFVLRFMPILTEAPLQIYSSGLLFSPEASVLRKVFVEQVPQATKLVPGRDAEWDACRSVLAGHSRGVTAVVFSPNGQLLASASYDGTVRVWETATGACCNILEGHSDWLDAVVFSPDGQLLVSVSYDNIVIWEVATGACRSTLEGHSHRVRAIVFSPNGQLLVSASNDDTVRVWEIATGACRSVLKGHSYWVDAVVFSPNGQLVASVSSPHTVRVWETATGARRSVLEGYSYGVIAVVFSTDGQLFVTASKDGIVRVWEIETGSCRSVVRSCLRNIDRAAFSPDRQLVALVSYGNVVQVWETATGACQSVLVSDPSTSRIAFSPDGRTLSTDKGDISVPAHLVTGPPILQPQESSHSTVEGAWVLCQKRRVLWLPPQYWDCPTAVCRHMIALGCFSGRLVLLSLPQD